MGASKVIVLPGGVTIEVTEEEVDPQEVDRAAAQSSLAEAERIHSGMSEEAQSLLDPTSIGFDERAGELQQANQGSAGGDERRDALASSMRFYFYRVLSESATRPDGEGKPRPPYPTQILQMPEVRSHLRLIAPSPEKGKGENTQLFATSDFFLRNIEEQDAEKYQVFEGFGSPILYVYGKRPKFVTYAGVFYNLKNLNWANNFSQDYERELRATKAVEKAAQCYISYDNKVDIGYIINLNRSRSADTQHGIPFSFTMMVVNQVYLNGVNENGERGDDQDDFSNVVTEDVALDKNPMNATTLEELNAATSGTVVPEGNNQVRLVAERFLKSRAGGAGSGATTLGAPMVGYVSESKDVVRPGELSVTFSDPLTSDENGSMASIAAESPEGLVTVPRPSWSPGRTAGVRRIVLMDARGNVTDASLISKLASGGSAGTSPHYVICRGDSIQPNTGTQLRDGQIIQMVQESNMAHIFKDLKGAGRGLPTPSGPSGERQYLNSLNGTMVSQLSGERGRSRHTSWVVVGSGSQRTGMPFTDMTMLKRSGATVNQLTDSTVGAEDFARIYSADPLDLTLEEREIQVALKTGNARSGNIQAELSNALEEGRTGSVMNVFSISYTLDELISNPVHGGYNGLGGLIAQAALGSKEISVGGETITPQTLINIVANLLFQESKFFEKGWDTVSAGSETYGSAAGIAQFIHDTGRRFGLRIDLPNLKSLGYDLTIPYNRVTGAKTLKIRPNGNAVVREYSEEDTAAHPYFKDPNSGKVHIDDRFDPLRAVQACYKYIVYLLEYQKDRVGLESANIDELIKFAIASYNRGESGVRGARKKAARKGGGGGTNFESIKEFLPEETQTYVERIVGTMVQRGVDDTSLGVGATDAADVEPVGGDIADLDASSIYVMFNGPRSAGAPYTEAQLRSACQLIGNILSRKPQIVSSGKGNGLVGRRHAGGVNVQNGKEVMRFVDPVSPQDAGDPGFDFGDASCVGNALAMKELNLPKTFIGQWGNWWDPTLDARPGQEDAPETGGYPAGINEDSRMP